jgi:predicted transposase/invertase (TIGR01784 family)
MANKNSPHDKFFKITMTRPEVAKKFLTQYLPENIKDNIDFNTLTLQKESFIDRRMKGLFVDLLYSAKFGKNQGYIYILFEHLSSPDKKIAFRLLKYMINIMDYHLLYNKKLPLVFPIILYTGKNNQIHSIDIFDLFGEEKELARSILLNPYYILNINNIKETDLEHQHYLATMVKAYKCRFYKEYKIAKSLIPHLNQIDKIPDLDYITSTIKYITETSDIVDYNRFFNEIYNNLSKKTEEEIMTIADRLRQEGIERGMERGMQQGILQDMQQGKHEGKVEGKHEALEQVALTLVEMGKPIPEIAKITKLPTEKIEALIKEKEKNK